ncbi:GldG family protein [Hyphomicrobium sp.]|uniref:GldG family protein n=1 Tax=Hyphomicrobium sp. TaxID=82 RepID=UPI002E36CBCF|nr:Gldg family protein [Hyphomicrobium sp.]HEX2842588.1 Gldg family protein [Hyphomicrobium sp.]
MNDFLASVRARIATAFSGLVDYASRLTPARLAWGGLALAAVTLLSVNLIASQTLGGWKADLTEDKLYSISPGSVTVLTSIDEPIKARLYFTKKLGEIAPSYARYFDRIRSMLEEYQRISGGKLQLEILDPEPFSDAEDQAVAAGLRGRQLNAEGEMGYFGLAASNSTDNQEVIGFFSPDRENFVEYDVTKLIHALANPKKRTVGLMTSLPLDGGQNPMTQQQSQPWLIMSQIREFFDVQTVDQAITEIPSKIDVLLVAQPTTLTPQTAYAIDQYALKGGKLLVLIDPMAEAAQLELLQKQGEGRAELAKLLKTWGVGFDPSKTAADIRHARRVQFGREQGMVTEYVAWLGLDQSNIDQRDVLSSGITNLNLASAGILTNVDGATTTVTPILKTSSEAMEISTQKVGMSADPIGLLRAYKPGGHPLTLAVRISGDTKTTFPNGAPKPEAKKDKKTENGAAPATDVAKEPSKPADTKPGPGHIASGRVNAIVVADTDLMADRFWVESREMLGQEFAVPSASNAAFIVGALENLTGSDALIALRGRGIKERTFTLVEDLRRDAERKFREKEEALTAKLKSVEQELEKLQTAGANGNVVTSDKEREAIEGFTNEMLETRRELRQVKLALRQSIDSLDGWLQFANIALIPLLIAVGGVGWTVWRSRRTPKS